MAETETRTGGVERCPFCVGLPDGVPSMICPHHHASDPDDMLSELEHELGGEAGGA